jgi:hypothetical protein
VKRVMLGAAATAVAAVATVLVPQVADATGSTGGSQVSINQYADFNLAGTQLDVGLQVSCTGVTGVVNVSVDQYPPETPIEAHGTGVMDVVCDGKTHSVGVTIIGAVFDAGKAKATAMLIAPSGNKTVSRQIVVKVV